MGSPRGSLSPKVPGKSCEESGEKYGLTKFHINNLTDNLGSSYSPEEPRSRVSHAP